MWGFTSFSPRGCTMPFTAMTNSGRRSFAALKSLWVAVLGEDELDDALAVAQVDENQASQVAAAPHPSLEDDRLPRCSWRMARVGRAFGQAHGALSCQPGGQLGLIQGALFARVQIFEREAPEPASSSPTMTACFNPIRSARLRADLKERGACSMTTTCPARLEVPRQGHGAPDRRASPVQAR